MAQSLQGGTPAHLQMSGCSSRLDSSFDPGSMSMHSTVDWCVMCFSMWAMRASTAFRISEGEMDSWSAAGHSRELGRGIEQVYNGKKHQVSTCALRQWQALLIPGAQQELPGSHGSKRLLTELT